MSFRDILFGLVMAAAGFAAGFLATIVNTPPLLSVAQSQFATCLELQAPREVCLRTYLLPKDAKP